MTKYQQAVVDHIYGPACVSASAGSGKTFTLINRLKELVKITKPERIIMLTFTNDAANEMKNREAKYHELCKSVIACTYHKYCGMLLRKFGSSIGLSSNFEVLTGGKYITLIEYVKSSNSIYEVKDFPSASKLYNIFSTYINTDSTIADLIENTKYFEYESLIKQLFKEVKKYGYENNKLNFDDLLVYTNKLLTNETVCKQIAKSFDFIMVDEFQDTNKLQLNILFKLSKYNDNIVIVGDVSQSIYKFRGAKVENMSKFINYFDNCKEFELSINFRSNQEILDLVNDVMSNNVQSWTYNNMISNNRNGMDMPKLVLARNEYRHADWILNYILFLNNRKNIPLSDIAILERSSKSSFILENELLKHDISFVKRGGKKFTEYHVVDEI